MWIMLRPRAVLPVVCWSRMLGSKSLDAGLRDPREYARIGSRIGLFGVAFGAFSGVNKLPVVCTVDRYGRPWPVLRRAGEAFLAPLIPVLCVVIP
jgi:hypothetical protein